MPQPDHLLPDVVVTEKNTVAEAVEIIYMKIETKLKLKSK
jgi:hypothetical protein